MLGIDRCQVKIIHRDKVEASLQSLPAIDHIQLLADIFKSVGDPTRLKIVLALCSNELCVCDLAAICGLSDSATSHQLRVLRHLKVVRFRKEGKIVYYRLDDDHIKTILSQGLDHVRE